MCMEGGERKKLDEKEDSPCLLYSIQIFERNTSPCSGGLSSLQNSAHPI